MDTPPGGRGVDAWGWFALLVGTIFAAGAARPLGDPDIWWHVRVGQLILDSGIPDREPWAFTAYGREWVPTAWLSDTALAALHAAFGWKGIVAAKTLLSILLLWLIARRLFTLASSRIAAPLFALTAITLSPFLAERPQLLSLVLVVWLVRKVQQGFVDGAVSWWLVPFAYVWANLHGMWVLVPMSLVVVSLGQVFDQRPGWRPAALRSAAVCGASILAAAVTPVGPKLAIWPLVVQDAAGDISEWQPTELTDRYAFAFATLFLVWVVAAARSEERPPRSEIIWVIGVFLFSVQAGRNVAPAIILLAPFAAVAMDRAYGATLARVASPTVPRVVRDLTIVGGAAAVAFSILSRGPLVEGVPLRIVETLKADAGRVRVVNSYNVGGVLTGFGAPEISVAIDGRTDNFEAAFVHRYLAATTHLVEWRKVVSELDADYAVVGRQGTLATELKRAGWEKVMTDGDFVLLEAPEQAAE